MNKKEEIDEEKDGVELIYNEIYEKLNEIADFINNQDTDE